jgi:selenocysteine lyase/cysteine desulfurase
MGRRGFGACGRLSDHWDAAQRVTRTGPRNLTWKTVPLATGRLRQTFAGETPMLASQRALFDIPRDVCYLNAAAWSPVPIAAAAIGRGGAYLKQRPWEIPEEFAPAQFERARAAAARLVNASADDIALIPSVGYGVSTAAKLFAVPAGHRVLVLHDDHSSPTLEWMTRSGPGGFTVEAVQPGADHDWTAALLDAIHRQGAAPLAMVSISAVHWSDGGLVDLPAVQEALRAQGAALLVDATHAAGVLSIDVGRLDPDFLVFPTYKWLLGPYARAFLYVAPRHQHGIPLEQTSYGRRRVRAQDAAYLTDLDYVDTARRFDMGERDFFVSLPVATHGMELLDSWGLAAVRERIAMLTRRIAAGLDGLAVTLLDDSLRAPNVLSLGFPDGMPEGLAARLDAGGVFTAPRLGRLRISPHVYNDETDCDRCVTLLRQVLC